MRHGEEAECRRGQEDHRTVRTQRAVAAGVLRAREHPSNDFGLLAVEADGKDLPGGSGNRKRSAKYE